MNHYGQQAMAHWRQHRPSELAAIEDQVAYFTQLGQQVQVAVTTLRDQILARDAVTDPVEVRRRARQATATAEEVVLADLVLLPAVLTSTPPDPILEAHYRALAEANRAMGDQP